MIADLYSEDSAPLSLAAALAMESARAGHYERVGGKVVAILPQAMAAKFIQLQGDANCFCPPSKVPGVPPGLDHVVLEVQFKPEWAQHKYFFVDLKK